MSKKIIAVNAGPRKGWNTDTLIAEAVKGAESKGAVVEKFDLSRFIGPTQLLVSGDTLQLKDYSKLDWEWSMFDPEAKKLRHETVFPQECVKAYDMGFAYISGYLAGRYAAGNAME